MARRRVAKTGTYLVEFINGDILVTGNNYKSWVDHMKDYFYRVYRDKNEIPADTSDIVKSVKYSGVPFVDDGGLKWASPKSYQELIDEEGAKQHQSFTPLKDIAFAVSYADKSRLKKEFKRL